MSNWVKIQDEFARNSGVYYCYDTDSMPLGQGGMGTVFAGYAFKDDGSNQYINVAIKRVDGDNPELINRAMQEASVQLDHPNLLHMYAFINNEEAGTYGSRTRHYIVMDLLDGVNLEKLVTGVVTARDGSSIEKAKYLYHLYTNDRSAFVRKLMIDVLQGLKCMHQNGYVHRDIDPSNIMVTTDGTVKIIDFGVTKQFAYSYEDSEQKTMIGTFIGKSAYAAPEVVVGDVVNHNATTDIYAVGILMYQMYVGVLPFDGDNASVRMKQMNEAVPVWNIEDKQIRKVVEKATQKDQAKRYANVDEMIADLNKGAEVVFTTPQVPSFANASQVKNPPFIPNIERPDINAPKQSNGVSGFTGGTQYTSVQAPSAAINAPVVVERKEPVSVSGILASIIIALSALLGLFLSFVLL